MKLLLLVLFFSLQARAEILPSIFYGTPQEKQKFCVDESKHSEVFWRRLMSAQIEQLINQRGEVVQNSFVSLSYLELFKVSQNDEAIKFMAYVYANASHHLGRLVRYNEWPKDHPERIIDRSLIKGPVLRFLAGSSGTILSKNLMHFSLDLYKELIWSLASGSICGREYTQSLLIDQNLLSAFGSGDLDRFVENFVTHEQSYLQKGMYKDFLIGSFAKTGGLDEMRYISFNGEEHTSFKSWAEEGNLRTTSFDLSRRIQFDVESILNEKDFDWESRAERAHIKSTALYFVQGLN